MSGGPVLDPGGRVIGIHGRADGKHVRENIDLKPDFYLAWFAKGFALGFDRQYAAALRACNRAIHLKLDYYNAWYCKAHDPRRPGSVNYLSSSAKKKSDRLSTPS